MENNILDYLEKSAVNFSKKKAVVDEFKQMTYAELSYAVRKAGSALTEKIGHREPVAVFMEKGCDALCTFFAIVSAGGCYTLLNPELPEQRLQKILSVLRAKTIITSKDREEEGKRLFPDTTILCIEDLLSSKESPEKLLNVRKRMIDTDPLYINFTSGSTGEPKGIVVCHRSVIDFINCFTSLFNIQESDVIANQAPFDFDVSVKDIYSAIKTGATLEIIPRRLFSAPVELIDFLCKKRVTTLIWAVSALCLISTFHGLDYRTPETIEKVLFSGEVMPYKHFQTWKKHLPEAEFVNLYGPTEITCNCAYHILVTNRDYSEGIPVGVPFPNEEVFLLSGDNRRIYEIGEIGEICVRGTALALGYYGASEQTAASFVQDPENPFYPELIYKTGDLGKWNEQNELLFCGRKDFQIKYMGHRIELEEIERAMNEITGVEQSCCVFDEKKQRLKGFFVGTIERDELHTKMMETLPIFMIPGFLKRVEYMPLTKNGKIDRKQLS